LFWVYYAIGPLLSLEHIAIIAEREGLFFLGELFDKIFNQLISFLLIFPAVWVCGVNDFRSRVKVKLPSISLGMVKIFIISISFYFILQMLTLWPNFILQDNLRAVIYVEWIESNSIITLAMLALFISYPFLNNRWIYLFSIPLVFIDLIMGRRHLIGIFMLPIIIRLNIKLIILFVGVIGVITSARHGVSDISSSFYEFMKHLFSESYMIMLSSASHSDCDIVLDSFYTLVHFERYTEYCRQMDYAAGGFSARMQYDFLFGVFSAVIFSAILVVIFLIGRRYINTAIYEVHGIVIFESLFILYRDDMGNSLAFMIKYTVMLIVASNIIYLLVRLRSNASDVKLREST
jgi:hypothetical protein